MRELALAVLPSLGKSLACGQLVQESTTLLHGTWPTCQTCFQAGCGTGDGKVVGMEGDFFNSVPNELREWGL